MHTGIIAQIRTLPERAERIEGTRATGGVTPLEKGDDDLDRRDDPESVRGSFLLPSSPAATFASGVALSCAGEICSRATMQQQLS